MTALTPREAELEAENRHLRYSIRSRKGHVTRRKRADQPAKEPAPDMTPALLAYVAGKAPERFTKIIRKLGRLA